MSKLATRYKALMPVSGYKALFKLDDGSMLDDDVVCFAIQEGEFAENDDYIVACVLLRETGSLIPAESMGNFDSVVPISEWTLDRIEEIES